MVAQALGGKVELNQKGWELAVRQIVLAESAKGIFDLKNATMVSTLRIMRRLMVAITTDAPGYSDCCTSRFHNYWIERQLCLSSTDNTWSRSLRTGYRYFLALLIIGHPEFSRDIVEFLLDNRFGRGLFSKEAYDEAYPHAADEDDGVKIGVGIMNFILGVTA